MTILSDSPKGRNLQNIRKDNKKRKALQIWKGLSLFLFFAVHFHFREPEGVFSHSGQYPFKT